ncbi:hypothetical protein [Actinoplanes rectilineatus]|uniref:hypothetical protein n=1 Tax=Actinoplanes rectilineatus TaxID=113571 RepID=UPI0005F2DC00|nr:hypothetical protein [Actinoplanes rectilineatus]
MSDDPEARLAYGITLYSGEAARVAEVGKWGEITVGWYDSDAGGLSEQLFSRLYDLIPDAPALEYAWQKEDPARDHWGVDLVRSGTWDYSGWILVATRGPGETYPYASVEWSDVMELDLDALAHEDRLPDWDARITAAITALEITPTQTTPKWLVFPFYG